MKNKKKYIVTYTKRKEKEEFYLTLPISHREWAFLSSLLINDFMKYYIESPKGYESIFATIKDLLARMEFARGNNKKQVKELFNWMIKMRKKV